MIKAIKSLIDKSEGLYVATSMGSDSVACLHWMLRKRYRLKAIHYNHKMRPQNDEMEKKFQDFCNDFKVEGICGFGSNLKTEQECRAARINFFSQQAELKKVVTAHHLNDWVEGYILNCFRGKNEHDPIPLLSSFKNFEIVHPFLLTRKKDFEQYVDRNKLNHYIVEDETNTILKGSRRNWIRHKIIPEMEKNQLSLEKFAKRKIGTLAQGLERKTHNLLVGGSIPSRPTRV